MATVTVTLASSLLGAKQDHGSGCVLKSFESAAGGVTFGGAGDVLLLAKLPKGARIADLFGTVACAATSVQGVVALCEVLGQGTLSVRANLCSLSAITAGGALKTGTWAPIKVSISDDAAVQHAMLAVKASGGTQSTSFSIYGAILYDSSLS